VKAPPVRLPWIERFASDVTYTEWALIDALLPPPSPPGAPVPSLSIQRGLATPALLAHVLVGKYADHCPLYRQAEIYARSVSSWTAPPWPTGLVNARLVRPLVDALGAHVMAAERVHADDTTVPVLDPGRGTTRLAAQRHPRCCIATAQTAKVSIGGRISPGSAASCRRTAVPVMPGCASVA
jgi:hypothetical protein